MNKMLLMAAMVTSLSAVPATAATTVNWSFAGTMYNGSGTLTYDETTDLLTAFTGKYNNQSLSLVGPKTDPNNPGAEINYDFDAKFGTYRAVPNTNYANYTFDNKAHQTPDTQNFLVSTGTGDDEIVYILGYDGPNFFFFHIVADPYQYIQDNGTFTTSAISDAPAVPEPATWAMMLLGFGMIAGGARYRRRATKVSIARA